MPPLPSHNTAAGLKARAFTLHRRREIAAARQSYARALALIPAEPEALNGLAAVILSIGGLDRAEQLLGRVLALAPEDPLALINRGLAAADRGGAKRTHMMIALALAPALVGLLDAFAAVEAESARGDIWMGRAIATQTTADRLLRRALAGSGAAADARRLCQCRRALALDPAQWACLNGLGKLLYDRGDRTGGVQAFWRALRSDGLQAAAWANIALAQHDLGGPAGAIRAGKRAVVLDPQLADAFCNLGNALLEARPAMEGLAMARRALALDPRRVTFLSNVLMAMAYVAGMQALQSETAIGWWQRRRPAPRPARPRRRRGSRLRVGYSSSFSLASTRHLGLAAIAEHDPGAVEVFAYVHRRQSAEPILPQGPAFLGVRDITQMSDAQAAAAIVQDRLDILIDLCGHTPGNRLGVFRLRPAPTQATWIETFFTTGVPEIDWFITDDAHSPPGQRQRFIERRLRLTRLRFCYRPPQNPPAVGAPPRTRAGYVTFGCFNYPPKIGDEVIALWAEILKAADRSRLRLKWWSMADPSVAASIRARFAQHGIGGTQLELSGASSHNEMLAEYGDIDVALDPFPFTGGATTCEALLMGVPVVSLSGDSVIERQSASLLRAIGAGDLVAATKEQYRAIVARLLADDASLATRRPSLRAALLASPLTDAISTARALETAYCSAVGGARP